MSGESYEQTSWSRPRRRRRSSRAHVDYEEMSVRYGSVKLQLPRGFKSLLEHLTREILREQPANIPEFAAAYFKHLLQKREDGLYDASYLVNERIVETAKESEPVVEKPKDEAYEPVPESPAPIDDVVDSPPKQEPVVDEMPDLTDPDVQKAATVIQASFRGFQTRKSLSPQQAPTNETVTALRNQAGTSSSSIVAEGASNAIINDAVMAIDDVAASDNKRDSSSSLYVTVSETSPDILESLATAGQRRHSDTAELAVQDSPSTQSPKSSPAFGGTQAVEDGKNLRAEPQKTATVAPAEQKVTSESGAVLHEMDTVSQEAQMEVTNSPAVEEEKRNEEEIVFRDYEATNSDAVEEAVVSTEKAISSLVVETSTHELSSQIQQAISAAEAATQEEVESVDSNSAMDIPADSQVNSSVEKAPSSKSVSAAEVYVTAKSSEIQPAVEAEKGIAESKDEQSAAEAEGTIASVGSLLEHLDIAVAKESSVDNIGNEDNVVAAATSVEISSIAAEHGSLPDMNLPEAEESTELDQNEDPAVAVEDKNDLSAEELPSESQPLAEIAGPPQAKSSEDSVSEQEQEQDVTQAEATVVEETVENASTSEPKDTPYEINNAEVEATAASETAIQEPDEKDVSVHESEKNVTQVEATAASETALQEPDEKDVSVDESEKNVTQVVAVVADESPENALTNVPEQNDDVSASVEVENASPSETVPQGISEEKSSSDLPVQNESQVAPAPTEEQPPSQDDAVTSEPEPQSEEAPVAVEESPPSGTAEETVVEPEESKEEEPVAAAAAEEVAEPATQEVVEAEAEAPIADAEASAEAPATQEEAPAEATPEASAEADEAPKAEEGPTEATTEATAEVTAESAEASKVEESSTEEAPAEEAAAKAPAEPTPQDEEQTDAAPETSAELDQAPKSEEADNGQAAESTEVEQSPEAEPAAESTEKTEEGEAPTESQEESAVSMAEEAS